MLLASLLLAPAFADEPTRAPDVPVMIVRIGLAPAELVPIEIPWTPGTTTHRITSGVELDVTAAVTKTLSGEMHVTYAVMPHTRKVRGVPGEDGARLQAYVDRGVWPLPIGGLAGIGPGQTFEYSATGQTEDGRDVGLKLVAGPTPGT